MCCREERNIIFQKVNCLEHIVRKSWVIDNIFKNELKEKLNKART